MVSGGGGLKAIGYHIGVLKGMKESGFSFRSGLKGLATPPAGHRDSPLEVDSYIGSSAGAVTSTLIACGANPDDIARVFFGPRGPYPRFDLQFLLRSLNLPSFQRLRDRIIRRRNDPGAPSIFAISAPLKADYVEESFRKAILTSNDFTELYPELYITATQLNHSRKVIFGPIDSANPNNSYDPYYAFYNDVAISQAIACSISIPLVVKPYGIYSKNSKNKFHYYDGMIKDTLSVHVTGDIKSDFAIVSDMNVPYVYNPQFGDLAHRGLEFLGYQTLAHLMEQKITQYQKGVVAHRHLIEMAEELKRKTGSSDVEEFVREMRKALKYRDITYLYVTPKADEFDFHFASHVLLTEKTFQKFIEVGYQAFIRAIKASPAFISKLRDSASNSA